jgi:hypothetical protein
MQGEQPPVSTSVDTVHTPFGRTNRHQTTAQAQKGAVEGEKTLRNLLQVMSTPQPRAMNK